MACSHSQVIEYRPTYFNDFVFNPSTYKCIECEMVFEPIGGVDMRPKGSVIIEVVHSDRRV